jgi:hypothetical protein
VVGIGSNGHAVEQLSRPLFSGVNI